MATLFLLLLSTGALSLWSASLLFLIKKQRWDEWYSIYKPTWAPTWCDTCATLWLALLPGLLLGLLVSWPLLLAPLLVPPLGYPLYKNMRHDGNY